MFSAASVCVFVCVLVCQHDNFRTSKNWIMKLGVDACRPSSTLGVIAP